MAKTAQFIEETRESVDQPSKEPKAKRKVHPNSLKNLVAPWKPGDIPNPTGKNQHDQAAEIARAVFNNNPEAIYKAMVEGILKGNFYGFDVVANRAWGKLKEKVEHSMADELVKRLMSGRKRANGNG